MPRSHRTRWTVVPLRLRLTLWYGSILAAALAATAATAWVAMRANLYSAIDVDLLARAAAAAADVERESRALGSGAVGSHLLEHRAADAWRIRSPDGRWLFRAEAAQADDSPMSAAAGGVALSMVRVRGERLRTATAFAGDGRGGTYAIELVEPLRFVDRALTGFAATMAVGCPVLLLAACAGGYWISRRALRPVDRISSTARAVTARNLSERIPAIASGDELQRLTDTINAMLERLEQSFVEMTQFTADASHELRTPVAFIRTTAEVLLRRGRTEPEWREGVSEIQRETVRVTRLLDDMLTLARSEGGVESHDRHPVDLAAAVASACRTGAALAASKGLTFTAPAPAGGLVVSGDPLLLERLLVILIDNAVKYTADGGHVSVGLDVATDRVSVTIEDTGIGIAPDDLPRIFDRFYRSDKARPRESGGSGLGLAIARWIAGTHHASISVESRQPGGSKFTVVLPIDPAADARGR